MDFSEKMDRNLASNNNLYKRKNTCENIEGLSSEEIMAAEMLLRLAKENFKK